MKTMNNILETKITYPKHLMGKPSINYIVNCANKECENTKKVWKTVWDKDIEKGRIFTCSKKCCNSSYVLSEKQDRFKEKHGYDNVFQREDVKEKSKITWLNKYGVDNPFKSEEIKGRIKETLFENHGVDSPMRSYEIRERARKTREEIYGKENLQGFAPKNALIKTNLEKYGAEQWFGSSDGRMTLENFIKWYGEENGTIKYKKRIESCKITLDVMVNKYGFEDGNIRYLNWKKTCVQNLENFIKRYGELDGVKRYEEFNILRTKNLLKGGKNTKLNDFFETLLLEIIPFSTYEREFLINSNSKKYWYDFIVNNKIIIEIHGDFWHGNPLLFSSEQILPHPGTKGVIVSDIWVKDSVKKDVALSNNFIYLNFWEKDIMDDKKRNEIKEEIIKKINE